MENQTHQAPPLSEKPLFLNRIKRLKWPEITTIVVLAAWWCFNALTLTKYPIPIGDEGYYTSTTYEIITHGKPGTPVFSPHSDYTLNNSTIGRLWLGGQLILLKMFGVSLFTARFYMLLAWIATTAMVYVVTRRLYSHRLGLLAALVFGLSVSVFIRWRYTRPDPWLTFGLLLTFWLYLRMREQPTFKRAFWLGVVACLNLSIYISAVFFLAVLGVMVLLEARRKRNWQPVLGFGIATLVTLTAVVVAQIFPYPQVAYRQWFQELPGYQAEFAGSSSRWVTTLNWFRINWIAPSSGLAGVETGLALLGTGLALWKRQEDECHLAGYYLPSLVLFAIFFPDKGFPHVALWMPYMVIMIIKLANEGAAVLGRWIAMQPDALTAILSVPWLLINLAGCGWLLKTYWGSDWAAVMTAAQETIPEDAGIVASSHWWFAFPDSRQFLSHQSLVTDLPLWNNSPVATKEELLGYLVANNVEYAIWQDAPHGYDRVPALPSYNLYDLFDTHCVEIGHVDGYLSYVTIPTTARFYHCDFSVDGS